jgi:putative alpha-1,2-mannosidase
MAAWYVVAALGLYHAAPGSQAWELSSPVFERAVIETGARKLTIEASGTSRLRGYIQSATLGGKDFSRTWLSSERMRRGGALRFTMGAQPNRDWGTGPGAAPPSVGP